MKKFILAVLIGFVLLCAAVEMAFGQKIDAKTQVKNLALALVGTQPWAVGTTYTGLPSSNTVLLDFFVPTFSPAVSIVIPANCSGSIAKAKTAATGSTVITVAKNGSTVCTGTFAAAATTATWSGTGSSTTLTSSDELSVTYGTADATLSGISVSIQGTR